MKNTFIKSMAIGAITLSLIGTSFIKAHAQPDNQSVTQFGTDEEIAYTFSYDFTINAMNDKTQNSINYARQQIEKLKITDAKWAAGEFSRLLDIVEQEKINNCIALIDKAKASSNLTDISNARAALDELLTVTNNQRVLDYVHGLDNKYKVLSEYKPI